MSSNLQRLGEAKVGEMDHDSRLRHQNHNFFSHVESRVPFKKEKHTKNLTQKHKQYGKSSVSHLCPIGPKTP